MTGPGRDPSEGPLGGAVGCGGVVGADLVEKLWIGGCVVVVCDAGVEPRRLLGVGRPSAEVEGPAGGSAVEASTADCSVPAGGVCSEGKAPPFVAVAATGPEELFESCAGGWFTGLLQAMQAAQTRAAVTAVTAALAGITVPLGMDATVAKATRTP